MSGFVDQKFAMKEEKFPRHWKGDSLLGSANQSYEWFSSL